MKKKRILLLLGLSILTLAPAHAQWFGSVDVSGGINAIPGNEVFDDGEPMIHGLAQGELMLGRKKSTFTWKSTLKGKWEPKTTDNARLSVKEKNVAAVEKTATTKPLTVSLKSDFLWTPSASRNYSSWILYQYKNEHAINHSLVLNGDLEDFRKLSYYYEEPRQHEHKFEAGLKTQRSLGAGKRVLSSSLVLQAINSRKYNIWTTFKTSEDQGGATVVDMGDGYTGYVWKYRITPVSTDINLDGDIRLQMNVVDDDVKLKLTPGARISAKNALDQNSGATAFNMSIEEKYKEEWRDSTSLRESFNYLSITADSFLAADCSWRKVEAHAEIATQVYGRRLNDDTHQQPFRVKGIYPIGKANILWTFSPGHSLNFKNEMTVKHPDYLKICWYDRTAGYLDQLYRGNEQLRSPQTTLYELEYTFKHKRFLSKTSVSYKQVLDEVDQTWSNKTIEGREYKVFEWRNSADSRSLGLKQAFGWRGKIITANTEISYNKSRRVAKNSSTIKDSYDWRLKGDIAAKLGKGWSVGADAKYQSSVATFFTLFKGYCTLNAFVQKDFKKITLYLQAKDILDQTMETSYESEETQEYWIEQVRNNRGLVVLGLKWKF